MKIEVRNLTKLYKESFALNDVSFTLDCPKIYGLLGRNGAGKTTFMDILAGNILATSGEILINGKHPFDNPKINASICLIKEGDNFKKDLKIKHIIQIYSFFYPKWDQQLADKLLRAYHLDPQMKVKALSKGMESALGITVGLASKAPITIFDEPYIGLDAALRKQFYQQMLEEFEKDKRRIIFSTHLIDEVSLMFEEILILQEGKLILQESADVLRENTCAVSGPVKKVNAFIEHKKVIGKKHLLGMMTAYIFGSSDEASEFGLEVESIPTQDLMLYLTDKGGVNSEQSV